jgi:hypothetical protein
MEHAPDADGYLFEMMKGPGGKGNPRWAMGSRQLRLAGLKRVGSKTGARGGEIRRWIQMLEAWGEFGIVWSNSFPELAGCKW